MVRQLVRKLDRRSAVPEPPGEIDFRWPRPERTSRRATYGAVLRRRDEAADDIDRFGIDSMNGWKANLPTPSTGFGTTQPTS